VQAITQTRYGEPEALELRDVDPPTPGAGEVLLRVAASSINAADVVFLTGKPYLARLATGLLRPRRSIPGLDAAGTVEAVGPGVTAFEPGDEVFGELAAGAFAELAAAPVDRLVPKPANVTLEEAAATPVAGLAALHGIDTAGNVAPGARVLINGASGGVGSFLVQIARAEGADVVAVCRGANAEAARELGAGRVIDYAREDFTALDEQFDTVIDVVGNHRPAAYVPLLATGGVYVSAAVQRIGDWLGPIPFWIRMLIASKRSGKPFRSYISTPKKPDLERLAALLAEGKVRPHITGRRPLREVPAALREQVRGHARGKTVIVVRNA